MGIARDLDAVSLPKLKKLSSDADDDDSFSLLSKLINGSVGGFLGVFTLFPLDTVKTRIQAQKKPIYRNWFHALGIITRREGIRGLYHGFGVTLSLVTPELTVKLVTYDYVKHLLQSPNGNLTMAQKTLAAALAGFAQIHITTPCELIKVQLQTHAARHKTDINQHALNTRDVFVTVLQNEGIMGLYRGYFVTILRDVNFSMIYFPLYSFIIEHGTLSKYDPDRPANWVAFSGGCIAGLVASLTVTPFDVIKTRMQAGSVAYDGILHCLRKTMACAGPRALFAGATCRALLIAPLLGICQMVYSFNVAEKLEMLLEQSEGGKDL